PGTRSRRAVWLQGAGLAAVLAIALWPRFATLPILFSRGELMQWDGDSAYHLKRILYAISNFPGLPRFDPQMNWPGGAPCPWTDGFDLLAAAWGLLAGFGSPERATMAVLLFTPLLALLAVWAAIDLARLVIPEGPAREAAALSAGALTALAPALVYQSQVGFLDHHVAEVLSFLLLAGWALRRLPLPGRRAGVGIAWELAGALAATFSLWVFSGGVIYVGMAAAILLVALLQDERPALVGSGVPALAGAALAAALLSLPALRAHGRIVSYQFPSLLQPLLVAGAALALGLALAAGRAARGLLRRTALFAVLVLAAAALGAALLPHAAHELRAGIEGWLLRRDPWIATVQEFQPFAHGAPTFALALFSDFGTIGVTAPLLLAVGGWVIVRGTGKRGVAFVVLTCGFVLLVLLQMRFERIGEPLLMIDAAAVFAAIAQRKRDRPRLAAVRLFPALAVAVLVAADPKLREALTPAWARIRPEASAALALRDLAHGRSEEGAFSAWDHGHMVNVMSGLPTPTNGFGSYLDAAEFEASGRILKADARAFDAYLSAHRLRWVVAGATCTPLVFSLARPPFRADASRRGGVMDLEAMKSAPLSPLLIGGSGIPGAGLKHLERLMPVFGTTDQIAGLAFPLPALWVYERVPGAKLVGSAPAGARVVATLRFREQGRPHAWKAFADTGADGAFELIVPFPTGLLRPAVDSDRRYALSVNDGPPTEAEVPESAVRAGATVRVGRIAAGREGGGQPAAVAAGSLSVKAAPPPSRLATDIVPPKDSTIP
ncbi:MAG: STT3 domain-containing protein, partial [Anaeromyxobacteraceae bacterium]